MLHTNTPSRAEVLHQLERILQSQSLHGSESLRSFLQFIVTKVIDKQESQLKEYTIATEVFGRDGGFDPRVDSVVRVQAGRLRTKVQEYYAGEGKGDPILIELPKGHYSPSFSYLKSTAPRTRREGPGADTSTSKPADQIDEIATEYTVAGRKSSRERDRPLILLLSVLCIGLGLMSVYLLTSRSKQNQSQSLTRQGEPEEMKWLLPLWQGFIRSPEPILVAYSNTLFEGTAETGMKLLTPLDTGRIKQGLTQPLQSLKSTMKGMVITQHYTGVGEVMGVHCIGEAFGKMHRSIRVKRSLLLTWEDLKSESFIFLGSSAENLLLRDLPQDQDFVFRTVKTDTGNSEFGIVNLKPKPGEEKTYFARQEGPSRSQISEDFALISLLKGLNPQTHLMILAGVTTYGTQAAAEYVTRPEYAAELISHLNTSGSSTIITLPPYYQVLIRVQVNGEVPVHAAYVTHHVLE